MSQPLAAESENDTFAGVPPTAGGHFVLCLYAAIFRLLHRAKLLSEAGGTTLEALFERYPFLGEYFTEARAHLPEDLTWGDAAAWWREELAAWEVECGERLPLSDLAAQPGVGEAGRLAFMTAGLVEEDSRFGTLFAELQEPLAHRRPTLELVGQMAAGEPGQNDSWAICRPLIEAGFLAVADREAPRAEWVLKVPPLLWDAARGGGAGSALVQSGRPAPWCRLAPPEQLPEIAHLVQPPELLARLGRLPQLLGTGRTRTLVLRAAPGAEPEEVCGAVARALGRGAVLVEGAAFADEGPARLLAPLATLTRSLPVLSYDLGPGETAEPPPLPGYTGPLAIVLGLEGGLGSRAAESAVTLVLPQPRAELRERSWRLALGSRPAEDLPAIAERFQLAGGFIRRAAEIAAAHAALDGREAIALEDVQEAARALNRQLLDTLADRLEAAGEWSDLVCGESTHAKLAELESRCRHRERLLDRVGRGFRASGNRGVRALFTGTSGTGKTLAARILAAELGLDVYRVDLAAVINKYIGETEKNLHRVLSRAEALDVVLLLDEGDALLGNRTEVRSSNDRYANLETNYLLQRLETYQGIVVVTTNLGENVDAAFQRRMDVVVPFFPPQAEERWRILDLHLPADHEVSPASLERLAVACSLTGGQLRNAALHATLLALEEGGGPVAAAHLEDAVRSEYRKTGAAYPLSEGRRPVHGGVEAFIAALGGSAG
jgi:ATPase family protein associated with various cellular activities (AAA)